MGARQPIHGRPGCTCKVAKLCPYAPSLAPHRRCRLRKTTLRTHVIAFALPQGDANCDNPLQHMKLSDTMCISARMAGVAWVLMVLGQGAALPEHSCVASPALGPAYTMPVHACVAIYGTCCSHVRLQLVSSACLLHCRLPAGWAVAVAGVKTCVSARLRMTFPSGLSGMPLGT